MQLTRAGNVYVPNDNGHFVSENQRRIAELLRDIYPDLQLQWIPNDKRSNKDYAFRVVDATPGRDPYVVCFSHECDERLLARVIQADTSRHDILNTLDAFNAAKEALAAKEREEERMQMHELAFSVLRSKKIHYKHGGLDFGKFRGGRYE